jgi:ubiquinone/menaquinone biosynthesis C-methylase UbiE
MTRLQPLKAKLGEISFRSCITHQHLGRQRFFPEEYDSREMLKILKDKVERSRVDFLRLSDKGLSLSPFLEIGAGYGQASILLVNKFKASGYASDLALEPLLSLPHTARKLKLSKVPEAFVCDTEALPFPNNSFPFVFCYQTLHHFPHPLSVTREIERVLAPGGWFFFAEEPVAQTLNLSLWRRPTKLRWWEKILKLTTILHFISRIGKTEVDQGILEESFPLPVWREALKPFNYVEAKLFPFPTGPQGKFEKKEGKWQGLSPLDYLNRFFLFVLGGGITGMANKERNRTLLEDKALPPLACANCWVKRNGIKNRPKLLIRRNTLLCPNCKQDYVKRKGIFILLPKNLKSKLYPSPK